MAFYAYRAFGYAGDGVIGDVGFNNVRADLGWRGGMPLAATYTPLAPERLAAAKTQWQVLQDLIDLQAPSATRAQARMQKLSAAISGYAAIVDNLADQYVIQRDEQPASTAIVYYNQINGELSSFANESWPDAVDELGAAADSAARAKVIAADATARQAQMQADAAAAQAKALQTQEAIAKAQSAIATADQAKQTAVAVRQQAQATSAQRSAALKTPLTIAAIAVPLAIVAFFALRSRKSSVAGYRRRRRR